MDTDETSLARLEDYRPPAPMPDHRAGTAALAVMDQAEFDARLRGLVLARERVQEIHRQLMRPDLDYGTIPGTQKPTLLKPGAEKLATFYGYAAEFKPTVTYGDGHAQPPISIVMECLLHLGSLDGPVVNTGLGAASSWEKRYRYRRGERACPECGAAGSINRSKFPDRQTGDIGWYCHKSRGCGAQFDSGDQRIVGQVTGDVENPDPYDLLNTILKMAEKRAYVDAVLRATATSSLYTQDVEEMARHEEPAPARQQPNGQQQARAAVQRQEQSTYAGATVASEPGEEEFRQVWAERVGVRLSTATMHDLAEFATDEGVNRGDWRALIAFVEAKGDELRERYGNAPTEGGPICAEPTCGKPLTKGQHDVSMRAFGQPFCPNCQRKQAREA